MEITELLEHERCVIRWLEDYGALPRQLVYRLLWDRTERATRKFITNLIKGRFIYASLDGKVLSLDRNFEVDHRVETALWVLTRFIKDVDSGAFCPGTAISQVFFAKKKHGYEIVVLEHGEENLLKRLRLDQDDKCIVVLPDLSMTKNISLPGVPLLYATVEYIPDADPNIKFYSMEESPNGEDTDPS